MCKHEHNKEINSLVFNDYEFEEKLIVSNQIIGETTFEEDAGNTFLEEDAAFNEDGDNLREVEIRKSTVRYVYDLV